MPYTRSLRLPTTENASAVVNERSTPAEEIEVICLSSDDESQPTASNPQPRRSLRPHIPLHQLSMTSTSSSSSSSSTTIIDQPQANNLIKQFKCTKCWYRSNWSSNVTSHLRAKHGNTFANYKYVQTLDKAEAARTLDAYNREHGNTRRVHSNRERSNAVEHAAGDNLEEILQCKPFKCGMCEYRSGRRINTCRHIIKTHKLEHQRAAKLVTVLPMDEARRTVNMYNEARDRDGFFHRRGRASHHRRVNENLQMTAGRGQTGEVTYSLNQNPRYSLPMASRSSR
jgi:hypothetical protein